MSNCPKCGCLAYLGFVKVECTGATCANFSQKFLNETCNLEIKTSSDDASLKAFVNRNPASNAWISGPGAALPVTQPPPPQPAVKVGDRVQIAYTHKSHPGKMGTVDSRFMSTVNSAWMVQLDDGTLKDFWERHLIVTGVAPTAPVQKSNYKFAVGDRVQVNKPMHPMQGQLGTITGLPVVRAPGPYEVLMDCDGKSWGWLETSLVPASSSTTAPPPPPPGGVPPASGGNLPSAGPKAGPIVSKFNPGDRVHFISLSSGQISSGLVILEKRTRVYEVQWDGSGTRDCDVIELKLDHALTSLFRIGDYVTLNYPASKYHGARGQIDRPVNNVGTKGVRGWMVDFGTATLAFLDQHLALVPPTPIPNSFSTVPAPPSATAIVVGSKVVIKSTQPGKLIGEVVDIEPHRNCPYVVVWPSGVKSSYVESDLVLVP